MTDDVRAYRDRILTHLGRLRQVQLSSLSVAESEGQQWMALAHEHAVMIMSDLMAYVRGTEGE